MNCELGMGCERGMGKAAGAGVLERQPFKWKVISSGEIILCLCGCKKKKSVINIKPHISSISIRKFLDAIERKGH